MTKFNLAGVSQTLFSFDGIDLHGYEIGYYVDGDFSSYNSKRIFCLRDIEKILGFKHQGWHWIRTAPKIVIRKYAYSDAETILAGLDSVQSKTRKSKDTFKTLIKWMKNCCIYDNTKERHRNMGLQTLNDLISKETQNLFKPISQNKSKTTKRNKTVDRTSQCEHDSEHNKDPNEGSNTAEKTIDIIENNSSNFSWSFAFDNAKEITRYSEVVGEEIELTRSIVESKKRLEMLKMEALELQSNIEEKEEQSKRNRLLLQDFRLSLQSNPLLKNLIEIHDDSNTAAIDELKEKIDRLEKENQLLKDKIGEGENFRTANMFPNKEKYFDCKSFDPNNKLGLTLSKMANRKGIPVLKVRSGSMEVGNYPIWLHEKLKEWIENKQLNEYTSDLQPMLKPEYRAQ